MRAWLQREEWPLLRLRQGAGGGVGVPGEGSAMPRRDQVTTCPSGPRAWDFSCPARDLEIEVGMPPAAGRDPTCQPSNAGRPRGPGPVAASPAAAPL